ncbi:DMT family transporter [Tahibacter amnicola]|uniref:DMT family transporter n=1 Tax=Tahibacter amnicola TaxID=2976241 RepID=A0ABY6BPK4_9GAMM|nr:DMT family transporter [Tahibacter amnicola]UXI70345.1 DMT family transporter [Tahibacter amnicola]
MNTSAEAAPAASSPLVRAALLMVASAVLFGFMAVTIRLASRQLHAFEIAFFRSLFGAIFALPLLLHHGSTVLRTDKFLFYVMRCCIGIVSMLAGFWAIVHLPLAQAVSLSYSTPLFVTIGAVVFLGETVRLRRWSAVLIGFAGVLIIVRPGADSFSAAALVALLAAAMSGTVAISIKFLSRTEHPDAIVLITSFLWVVLSLPPALLYWEWPNPMSWLWVILAGGFGTVAHLCWTRALKLGEVSALTPLSFLQLPVVVFAGYFLFEERLDIWTAVGAGVIVASNVYIAHREARLARRQTTDPDVAAGSANS